MKTKIFFALAMTVACAVNAQDFNAEFTKAQRDADTLKQKEILASWENSKDRSAEFFLAKADYWFAQAMQNQSHPTVDLLAWQNAVNSLNEGIDLYADRLDIRCAKIYALGLMDMWQEYTEELLRSIDRSYINDNKWVVPGVTADKNYFLQTVQQFENTMFEEIDMEVLSVKDSLLLENIRTVAKHVLKYYPDNTDNLNNLAATYFYENDYDTSLDIFLKAEQTSPKDAAVLLNIANIYTIKGNKEKARQYYNNIIKNCDGQSAEKARQLLNGLQ
ncbi:MAG: tetratricopeptide repeat protein [Bacteroidales bacterium]|nr:tetratricopeptide repeat protein [Bacteroidales bacterium]